MWKENVAISRSSRKQLSTNIVTGRPATVGIAKRGDSRGICRVQRKVVLLGLRCRIPAYMHLLSQRQRRLFSALQLQRGRRKTDTPLRICVTAKCHRTVHPKAMTCPLAELYLRSFKHKRDAHPDHENLFREELTFIKLLIFYGAHMSHICHDRIKFFSFFLRIILYRLNSVL